MPIAFVAAASIRENAIRVEFSLLVNYTGLLDPNDVSKVEGHWSVAEDAATTGMNGEAARPVSIVRAALATAEDGVEEADFGRFVNLYLDRPLTPYPAVYAVSWSGIYELGTVINPSAGSSNVFGVYRMLSAPTIEAPRQSKDFANPQTAGAARASLPRPSAAFSLGTFGIDDTGDYAHDEGNESLKKRVIRRLVTRKNAFAHLPGYGVGVPDAVKKLATQETLSSLKVDAELQIAEEPDVAQVRVVIVISSTTPNLVRFRVVIRPKIGPVVAFEVPFDAAA